MRGFARALREFLHGRGRFAPQAPQAGRLRYLALFVIVFGCFYGAVMATYTGLAPGRYLQVLYVGLKVPLLLVVTFGVCLPSFFVVNAAAGLGSDFGEALHGVVAAQACVTCALAALSPVTGLFYLSNESYNLAILFNAAMFTVAAVAAQRVMGRYYGPLIARAPRHRLMLYFWFFFYALVGIQMGWLLRPFIGDPKAPVQFFRPDAWGNAYEVVARLMGRFLQHPVSW
jgi:hypothetical protein